MNVSIIGALILELENELRKGSTHNDPIVEIIVRPEVIEHLIRVPVFFRNGDGHGDHKIIGDRYNRINGVELRGTRITAAKTQAELMERYPKW